MNIESAIGKCSKCDREASVMAGDELLCQEHSEDIIMNLRRILGYPQEEEEEKKNELP